MDHGDGQERVPAGQLSCRDPSRHAQIKGTQFNLCLTNFEAKEGETKKELV
jgi:hypothetical protein